MKKLTFNEIPAAIEDVAAEISSIKSLLQTICQSQNKEPPPDVLNFSQALEFLNRHGVFIKQSSLYKHTYKGNGNGQIPHRKISGRLVFDQKELTEWINTKTQSQIKISTNQAVIKSAIKKQK